MYARKCKYIVHFHRTNTVYIIHLHDNTFRITGFKLLHPELEDEYYKVKQLKT